MILFKTPFDRPFAPIVMGILNVTPDSFAIHCQDLTPGHILSDFETMVNQGATVIDIGACSTRPDSQPVTEEEEWRRLDMALATIRQAYPDYCLSVDTTRAGIARKAIETYHVNMINDVSGLEDPYMLDVIAHARVQYILTHPREACRHWDDNTPVTGELLSFFSRQLDRLHQAGVADVIIDPGLGFGKTTEQNYSILRNLPVLKHLQAPVLIGLSRKSMIYQPLHLSPARALTGTIAAHTLALINGADILRVHDVAEAKQTVTIVQSYLYSH